MSKIDNTPRNYELWNASTRELEHVVFIRPYDRIKYNGQIIDLGYRLTALESIHGDCINKPLFRTKTASIWN